MSVFHPLRTFSRDGTAASMNLNIRTATAADVHAMHRLRRNVLENRLSERTGIGEASYLPFIRAGSVWLAESLSGIAGFAAVDARAQRVWALFVDPNCEGAGVGRALHDAMLAWCREQGLQRLFLSTEAGSRAVRFYRGAGWTQTGVTADGEVLFEKDLIS
jgi:GNAT superfamily N-acetyltransferase